MTYIKYCHPMINISNMNVDILFLDNFICQMSIFEKDWMENYEERRNFVEPTFRQPVDRELWKLENMKIIQ